MERKARNCEKSGIIAQKGHHIEILTEQQFQEMVIYEGKYITTEMIADDSRAFLEANQCNLLYGKNVCVSEGFSRQTWRRLSHLGISSGVSFWADEADSTDYFILSNTVLEDLKRGMMKVHPNEDPHLAELY